jgi:hypothetical protein
MDLISLAEAGLASSQGLGVSSYQQAFKAVHAMPAQSTRQLPRYHFVVHGLVLKDLLLMGCRWWAPILTWLVSFTPVVSVVMVLLWLQLLVK